MASFIIKQNDTLPAIEATLKRNGKVIDLSDASSVKFYMKQNNAVKVNGDAVIDNASEGKVVYYWQSGDTDVAGGCIGEFEVSWNDGATETFPNDSYLNILIYQEIN